MTPQHAAALRADREELAQTVRALRMNQIQPAAAARTASAFHPRHVTEGAALAGEVERNVERLCLRVIRHRAQTLEPRRGRTEVELVRRTTGKLVRSIRDLPRLGIDVEQVLVAEIVRVAERTGL